MVIGIPFTIGFSTLASGFITDSPLLLTVTYDGLTQFDFKFRAPSGSTLNIYDGDGTMTPVAGQDAVEVTHSTTYSAAGSYYFYVEGDYLDITSIDISSQSVSGNITSWTTLADLTSIIVNDTSVSGSISSFNSITGLVVLNVSGTSVTGSINGLASLTSMTDIDVSDTSVTGELSNLSTLEGANINASSTTVGFESSVTWNLGGDLTVTSSGWTSTEVDNCLISIGAGTTASQTIDISGTNAYRTSASDAAKASLLSAGNTVTVNEDTQYIIYVNNLVTTPASTIYTDGTYEARKRIVGNIYYIDVGITPTGFGGVEDTDWAWVARYNGQDSDFRSGVRDGNFVVDCEITGTGFSGSEDTDWENLSSASGGGVLTTYRDGIRDQAYVIDKVLTATGFAGVEDTDWENIRTYNPI